MKLALGLIAMTLAGASITHAQTPDPVPRPAYCAEKSDCQTKAFYLANASGQNDANEILVALRNLLSPSTKIYLVANDNAILIRATPEDLQGAQQIIDDLDRPKKTYRLTYTITESDAGKPIGTQHFSMIVVNGQRTTLKQGSKIPVITGSYSNGGGDSKTGPGVQTQYTYLDVGMNFDATLNEVARGAVLKSKVELSSIADQKSNLDEREPIVRQTVTEGVLFVPTGKPVILGSIDIVGSTRHVDIDVMMEPIP